MTGIVGETNMGNRNRNQSPGPKAPVDVVSADLSPLGKICIEAPNTQLPLDEMDYGQWRSPFQVQIAIEKLDKPFLYTTGMLGLTRTALKVDQAGVDFPTLYAPIPIMSMVREGSRMSWDPLRRFMPLVRGELPSSKPKAGSLKEAAGKGWKPSNRAERVSVMYDNFRIGLKTFPFVDAVEKDLHWISVVVDDIDQERAQGEVGQFLFDKEDTDYLTSKPSYGLTVWPTGLVNANSPVVWTKAFAEGMVHPYTFQDSIGWTPSVEARIALEEYLAWFAIASFQAASWGKAFNAAKLKVDESEIDLPPNPELFLIRAAMVRELIRANNLGVKLWTDYERVRSILQRYLVHPDIGAFLITGRTAEDREAKREKWASWEYAMCRLIMAAEKLTSEKIPSFYARAPFTYLNTDQNRVDVPKLEKCFDTTFRVAVGDTALGAREYGRAFGGGLDYFPPVSSSHVLVMKDHVPTEVGWAFLRNSPIFQNPREQAHYANSWFQINPARDPLPIWDPVPLDVDSVRFRMRDVKATKIQRMIVNFWSSSRSGRLRELYPSLENRTKTVINFRRPDATLAGGTHDDPFDTKASDSLRALLPSLLVGGLPMHNIDSCLEVLGMVDTESTMVTTVARPAELARRQTERDEERRRSDNMRQGNKQDPRVKREQREAARVAPAEVDMSNLFGV